MLDLERRDRSLAALEPDHVDERCSALEPTTVSSADPPEAVPNVPASICATTDAIPRRIERKFSSRSSQRNQDR